MEVPFVYFCFYFQYSGRWVTEDPAVMYVGECFGFYAEVGKLSSCDSDALNMPANLENSAVATGLEKVSFQWANSLK